MCRHVDFVAVNRHAISHSTRAVPVPVTGVRQDGETMPERETETCGTESGQTNQLAD